MVSQKYIDKQLKKVGFNPHGWGRGEIKELVNIILPDEEIYECVNGIYDGGFALLVATDIRVLLIDQKPMNYLTVEDLRFDMINEMDYSHRLFGARIVISSGNKTLKFLSYNQPRLRKLIGHVQHCMAEAKKKQTGHGESQVEHLQKINEQLQEYLLAQQAQQAKLQEQLQATLSRGNGKTADDLVLPEPIQPSPELKDYLFAQSLLAQHQYQAASQPIQDNPAAAHYYKDSSQPEPQQKPLPANAQDDTSQLVEEGRREVFGKHLLSVPMPSLAHLPNAKEVNPITIAYSKLPMALRNRQFGRPSSIAGQQPQNLAPQQQANA